MKLSSLQSIPSNNTVDQQAMLGGGSNNEIILDLNMSKKSELKEQDTSQEQASEERDAGQKVFANGAVSMLQVDPTMEVNDIRASQEKTNLVE
jgi:hypothetical protein